MKRQSEKIRYNVYLKKEVKTNGGEIIYSGSILENKISKSELQKILINGYIIYEKNGNAYVKPNNIYIEEIKIIKHRLSLKEINGLKQLTKEEYKKVHKLDKQNTRSEIINISNGENKIRKKICKKCDIYDGCKSKKNKLKRYLCNENNIKFHHIKYHKRYKEIKERESK